MVGLLILDKSANQVSMPMSTTSTCLDYLLSENILDGVFEWGMRTGKYVSLSTTDKNYNIYEAKK